MKCARTVVQLYAADLKKMTTIPEFESGKKDAMLLKLRRNFLQRKPDTRRNQVVRRRTTGAGNLRFGFRATLQSIGAQPDNLREVNRLVKRRTKTSDLSHGNVTVY